MCSPNLFPSTVRPTTSGDMNKGWLHSLRPSLFAFSDPPWGSALKDNSQLLPLIILEMAHGFTALWGSFSASCQGEKSSKTKIYDSLQPARPILASSHLTIELLWEKRRKEEAIKSPSVITLESLKASFIKQWEHRSIKQTAAFL